MEEQEPTSLTVTDQQPSLPVMREPTVVLEEASRAAKALQDVFAKKKKPVMMNGEQFLEFEDWQLLGQFYGYTVKTGDAEPVEIAGVTGAKARSWLFDRTGRVVGGAEAYCLRDEPNWREKPWFQLASMAQTRSGSKAFRNRLAWVVVMAGYKPTPAEELDEQTFAFHFPFGPHKGKIPEDLTTEQLCEEQARFQLLADDPTNKFKEANRKGLEAIKAALDKRHPIHASPLQDTKPPLSSEPKGDNNLFEWALAQLQGLRPNQKAQAIGIMNTHKDHPKLSLDQRTALIDAFNEKFAMKEKGE